MQREMEQEIEKLVKQKPKIGLYPLCAVISLNIVVDFRSLSREQLSALSVKDIKQIFRENNISALGLVEKTDFVDKLVELKNNKL